MPGDLELLMDMGFPKERAEKALVKTSYKGLQPAMDWLIDHAEDPDIDVPVEVPAGHTLGETSQEAAPQPETTADSQEPKSLKCDDCGKLLRSENEIQMHAARSGHTNFSESTDEIKPLSEEEKKAQMEKLQQRLREKKLEKDVQERKEVLDREKRRREQGRNIGTAKAKFEEDEMRRLADQKKKEKEEEKLYKQKLRDDIARDRAEKQAKANPNAALSPAQTSAPIPPQTSPTSLSSAATGNQHTKCRLQIRLTNGQSIQESFEATEQLSAVRLFIQMRRTDGEGSFKLLTNFPKRIFTEEDMNLPLKALGLCPSSVLLVQRI